MGFFDRFLSKQRLESRKAKAARKAENAGSLGAAVDLYLEAELPDEAARVLLLRADAESSIEKRIAFAALAARTAVTPELVKKAGARKAMISFDVLRGRGSAMRAEMLAVASELEASDAFEQAAEAFALAGDSEGEVRALTAGGAIDKLEDKLRAEESSVRERRELETLVRRIEDLDRTAERRAALALAEEFLKRHPNDRIADAARSIRARLVTSAIVELEVAGARGKYALGHEVTIGRGEATLVIASRAVSRTHVRIARDEHGPFVEDLKTRNGTSLAGARIGRLAIGTGVTVALGGEVPCAIVPTDDGLAVRIDVGGHRVIAPLAALAVGAARLGFDAAAGDEGGGYLVLEGDATTTPYLGEYKLAARVELAVGDEIRAARGGEVLLRVLRAARRSDEEEAP